jgi:hypothetical protein
MVVAVLDWRLGIYLCIVVAMLQDPARKLVPGQPTYFIVFVGLVFAAAWVGALSRRVLALPHFIHGWRQFVGLPFVLLMSLVAVQTAHSLGRWGAPVMTAMGLSFFLAPALAVALAYRFAVSGGVVRMRRWLWCYVALATSALSGIYLEFSGLGWKALGEVGVGIVIYDVGRALEAYSGFFRASETAAWHASTAGCAVFLLLVGKRGTPGRWIAAIAFVALMIGLGVLTGRRKMLVMMAIFFLVYFALAFWFQRGQGKLAMALAMIAGASVLASVVVEPSGELAIGRDSRDERVADDDIYRAYLLRGQSVAGDIGARFEQLGIGPVEWAVRRHGVMGAGLGVATQGAAAFGPRELQRGGAGEGGLGKLTVELGLPGLVIVGWLVLAFSRYAWRVTTAVSAVSASHGRLAFGLAAFLIANLASFSVAAQAFGDIFILLFIGIMAGFFFSLPVVTAREIQADPVRSNSATPFDARVPAG